MKKFLAIYLGSPTSMGSWNALDPAKRKELEAKGIQAWGDWMNKHKAIVLEQGGPLGKTKRTDAKGVSDVTNAMTGYVVIQAESQEAAAKLFEKHPHFTIFPGEAVEVMEVLPIPGR